MSNKKKKPADKLAIKINRLYRCTKHSAICASRDPGLVTKHDDLTEIIYIKSLTDFGQIMAFVTKYKPNWVFIKPGEPFLVLDIKTYKAKLLAKDGIVWVNYYKVFKQKFGFVAA